MKLPNHRPAVVGFENTYAYVVKWNGMNSATVFIRIVKQCMCKVRYAEDLLLKWVGNRF